jgi:uncharacterized protein (UPF0248 family)
MQPLHELLHRIKWDAEFGTGEFALSYEDRVAHQEMTVPFASITLDPGRRTFSLLDEDGVVAHIPLHRVRAVYKDGAAIWLRPRHQAGA